MGMLDYLPFTKPSGVLVMPVEEATDITLPVKARAIRPTGVFTAIFGSNMRTKDRSAFEESPYNFTRIAKAIDTDSYAKQAFAKYKDLFWKEGWTITGENQEATEYIWARISVMERLMNQSFEDFLSEVVDQLIRYSNVFIAIARKDISSIAPKGKVMSDDEKKEMIAGFYIIPTESVQIKRNKFNKPLSYAQKLESNAFGQGEDKKNYVTWPAKDVIHLYLDRKPGRAFGTPFVEPTLDDIVSLRQIEEDILNLVHRELFPLYLYKVGSDAYPAKEGEIEEALSSIQSLKAEGGLVSPWNHEVEVIGAQGNALEADNYLSHFKERVAIGLGVSPHHLGMIGTSSNRSVTERLDLALYDRIKNLQSYFENAMRLFVINGLLEEGGFQPTGPVNAKSSDECFFDFNEIDIDTQIKKENHYVDLYLKSAITFSELRDKLKLNVNVEAEELFLILQAKVQAFIGQSTMVAPSGQSDNRPDAKTPAPIGQVNLPNLSKSTSTKDRPINQHKRLQSPNIKNHLDVADIFTEQIIDLLTEDESDDE